MPNLRVGPLCLAWEEALSAKPKRRPSAKPERRPTLSSPRGGSRVEPERRPSVPSMRGDPLFLEPGRRPSVPSLREGPSCLAWEEALSAVPYRMPFVSSLRGAPVLNLGGCPLFLVREEALGPMSNPKA